MPEHIWHDQPWLARRAAQHSAERPMNIYQMAPGSWRRDGNGGTLAFREMTRWLVPYAKELGVTHILLLDLTDRPQAPDGLLYLIDELHRSGVGALLDWPHGEDPAAVRFWLEDCHMDGLRLHDPDELLLHDARLPWCGDWGAVACQYMAMDPYFRQFRHKELTAPPPGGVLPLDRDAADGALLARMHGDAAQRFAGVRVLYTLLLTLPGKKALWMGSEFGQCSPWSPDRSLDWHLLEREDAASLPHRQLYAFFRAANAFYWNQPALWQRDADPAGVQWLCRDDAANTAAFLRFDKTDRALLCVFNLSPRQMRCSIGVPRPGRYTELFRTAPDETAGVLQSRPVPCGGMEHALSLDLAPLSALILKTPNQNKQVMK